MPREKKKWDCIKCSIKTRKDRKRVEDKETKNKCNKQKTVTNMGKQQSKYISNHFECKWSKCTNEKMEAVSGSKAQPTICCLQETPFKYKDMDGDRYTVLTLI